MGRARPVGTRRAVRPAALGAAVVLAAGLIRPSAAGAHVVYDRATLRQYVQHSAYSAWVEFEGPLASWRSPEGSDRQEYYRARVLARLAGEGPDTGVIEFFPHGEGLPRWDEGERALVFLESTRGRADFAGLAGRFAWFSVQESGEEWRVEGAAGARVLEAARAWAAWIGRGAEADAAGLRRLLAAELRSGVPALERDALAEILGLAGRPEALGGAEGKAELLALVEDPALPLARRAVLLRLLGPGGEAEARLWQKLVAGTGSAADRIAVARIAGRRDDPALSSWVGTLLRDADAAVRRAAASALAHPRHRARVPELAAALADDDPGVSREAMAALRSIGGPEARAALEKVAAGPPPRAAWAEAALRRLEAGGHAAPPP